VHKLSVSPEQFSEQMAYLRRTGTVLPLEELCRANAAGALPPRAVAVTFDDGYQDVLQEGLPILLGAGIPATVFATTAPPLEGATFHYWWDVLEWAILSAGSRDTLTLTLDDGPRKFALGTSAARTAAHRAIHGALVPLAAQRRDALVAEVLDGRVPDAGALPRRMSASELRALAAQPGMTIGAHGHEHLALPAHPSDRQRAEIATSREQLEQLLEKEISAFAYPFGAWSTSTAEIARGAGMKVGVTCEKRQIVEGIDLLACPRIEVPPSTTEAFAALLERTLASRPQDS
jgi:peptidoglycan/xylan/chitin deacetylase (PgdA/CDA1 family)